MCTWGCWAYFSLSFSAYWRATRSLSFMTPSFSLARAFHSRRHISSLPLTTYCSRKMCRQTPVATIQHVGRVERCKTIINCKKWVKYPIGSSQNEVTTKKCTSAPEQVFTINLFRLLFKITLFPTMLVSRYYFISAPGSTFFKTSFYGSPQAPDLFFVSLRYQNLATVLRNVHHTKLFTVMVEIILTGLKITTTKSAPKNVCFAYLEPYMISTHT